LYNTSTFSHFIDGIEPVRDAIDICNILKQFVISRNYDLILKAACRIDNRQLVTMLLRTIPAIQNGCPGCPARKKENAAMKYFRLPLSLWLVMIFAASAEAYDIQQGIHGMKWGSPIQEHKDLIKVHEWNQAAYYINASMYYEAARQTVPAVFYGFYEGRLFAAFIKLRSPAQFSNVERQFQLQYGKPKTTQYSAGRLTVHRWENKDIKIKLKLREAPVEYKLAIYYAPLAAELNEDQLENIPSEAYNKIQPEKKKNSKAAPLLNN
jgi:hypothetical protein